MEIYAVMGAIVGISLWFGWVAKYGFGIGIIAFFLRLMWISPIIIAFFPKTRFEDLPRTVALKPIHLLLDDSQSVLENEKHKKYLDSIESKLVSYCSKLGCLVKRSLLSDLSEDTRNGYTPLSRVLESWLYGTSGDPWIIVSDGGDYRPSMEWGQKLARMGLDLNGKKRGLILALNEQKSSNTWLDIAETSSLSFADKPINLSVVVHRSREILNKEIVQLQVVEEGEVLTTVNTDFSTDESSIRVNIPISSLSKGNHLLSIKALPTSNEKSLWDNEVHQSIEVLPNTIGVLHLLGSPSWDGRFLRRSLKSEPKYDLISFFILRDPGDLQLVNERELSLIPFPVDRLFNEELPNFKIVILQNFALYQFLDPTYQKNLVDFVKNGGGLLFLGGPRALNLGDIDNSSLSSILPFVKNGNTTPSLIDPSRVGSLSSSNRLYDPDFPFKIELADPDFDSRELAAIFDDWEQLGPRLEAVEGLSGIHLLDNVTLKEGKYTRLLDARSTTTGIRKPLALASYPGKGRAIWLLSDSLFKIALNPGPNSSRALYQDLISSALTWLLREEIKKPLIVRDFNIDNTGQKGMKWTLNLIGAAGKFLDENKHWKISICGKSVDLDKVHREKVGRENWLLSGVLDSMIAGGHRCLANIYGKHPAFGSLKTASTTIVPEIYLDREIGGSPQKLEQLAQLTRSDFSSSHAEQERLQLFVNEVTGTSGISFPERFRMIRDHFWFFDQPWIFLLLLALPLEVVVRRGSYLRISRQK